jgi:hypothetical protein
LQFIQFCVFKAEAAEEGAVITLDDKADNKDKSNDEKDEKITTEISFGQKNDSNSISVTVSPSCMHCAKFIADEFEEFVKKTKDKYGVKVRFLPTSLTDVFIMKLIQNKAKDENGFFLIFKNYAKRAYATVNRIKPTDKQRELFNGSRSDSEMLKFQVVASDFGFSDEEIVHAIPDMDAPYEVKLMKYYRQEAERIRALLSEKEVSFPIIFRGNTKFDFLKQALKESE